MGTLKDALLSLPNGKEISKEDIVHSIHEIIVAAGYPLAEQDDQRPWGAFFRLEDSAADTFIAEFFEGLDPADARLGNPVAPLSPKILLVAPGQRLSWQYHDRRAERWAFLTDGGFVRSLSDDLGDERGAQPGDVVQFAASERHRLVGVADHYTFVAEIWQHTDPGNPSTEEDIIRLADDYKR